MAGFAAFWAIGMETFFNTAYNSLENAYNEALVNLGLASAKVHSSAASLSIYNNLITPAAQVAWAAVSGAALTIAAKSKDAFGFNLFGDMKFLLLFIIPVILHSVWNAQVITYDRRFSWVLLSLQFFLGLLFSFSSTWD